MNFSKSIFFFQFWCCCLLYHQGTKYLLWNLTLSRELRDQVWHALIISIYFFCQFRKYQALTVNRCKKKNTFEVIFTEPYRFLFCIQNEKDSALILERCLFLGWERNVKGQPNCKTFRKVKVFVQPKKQIIRMERYFLSDWSYISCVWEM